MTSIYGIFDPRFPDVVMYIGKGLQKRASSHWKFFLRKGVATNALLRRWFEKLQSEGVEPSWRFLEENVINWQKAERDWITCARVINLELCNVAPGGNSWSLESSRIGGTLGGRKNVESGHLARIRKIAMESVLFKKGRQIAGRKNVESGHLARIRKIAKDSGALSKGGLIGGPIGGRRSFELHPGLALHCRWHVRRGIVNPNCKLCQEANRAAN